MNPFYYRIRITADKGSEKEILLDGTTGHSSNNEVTDKFKEIHIKVDAEVQDANSRSSKIVNSVVFKINVDKTTHTQCKDLMDWALTSKGPEVYRTVQIDVYDDQQLLRSFHLNEMFLDDYEEDYGENEGTFTVKLLQKPGYAPGFKSSITPL